MNKSTNIRFIKQSKENVRDMNIRFDSQELKEIARDKARSVIDITPPEMFEASPTNLEAIAVSFDFDRSPWCYDDWKRDAVVTLVASNHCAQMIRIPLECVNEVVETLEAYAEVLVNLDKDVKAAFDAIDEAHKSEKCAEAQG